MLRPQVADGEDGSEIWRVAVIVKMQSWRAEEGDHAACGREGGTVPQFKIANMLRNIKQGLELGRILRYDLSKRKHEVWNSDS
jgi:hypothetical protein